MQALTQSAWHDGAHDQRPQHCMEHVLCWAEDVHTSCAALTSGKPTVAATATAADSMLIRKDIRLSCQRPG
jgi:hypothetical protein